MAISKKDQRLVIDKVLILLGVVTTLVLLTAGVIAWKGYVFASTQVTQGLSEQNIYFPPAGSPSFSAEEYPTLQKYAGQKVDNGDKARAYADDFIGHHLTKIAGGKTYSEVSALAMADPTNETLQKQKATLFQGETLRGLLLTAGYSFWTMGMLARDAAIAFFVGAGVMVVLVALGLTRIWRQK